MLLVGGLVGVATLFRHQATIQIFAYGTSLLLLKRENKYHPINFSVIFYSLLGISIGLFTIWFFIYLLLMNWGAWEAFYQWGILHNFSYVENGAKAPGVWKSTLENGAQVFGSTFVFWTLGIIGICHGSKLSSKFTLRIAFLYLMTALIAAMTGFRFYPHYFIQCFPPLAILATFGFQYLSQGLKFQKWYSIAKIGIIVSLLAILIQNALIPWILKIDSTQDYAFSKLEKIGKYIEQRTGKSDTLFIWGWGEGIHYYSNRGMGTRFVMSDFLSGRVPASDAKLYSPELAKKFVPPERWEMFIHDMETNQPLYVVDTSPAKMHDYQYFPVSAYPVLKLYLEKKYNYETTLEGVNLFRRKDVIPPPEVDGGIPRIQ